MSNIPYLFAVVRDVHRSTFRQLSCAPVVSCDAFERSSVQCDRPLQTSQASEWKRRRKEGNALIRNYVNSPVLWNFEISCLNYGEGFSDFSTPLLELKVKASKAKNNMHNDAKICKEVFQKSIFMAFVVIVNYCERHEIYNSKNMKILLHS